MSGNTKDVCVVHAKAQQSVSNADAEAAYENTPKHRQAARLARADTKYAVAVEKCDDLAGNGKDVCESEAKADASVDRVNADTRLDAAEKKSEARAEAKNDKATAEYDVAVEKCDVLAGQVKDECIAEAKTRFGKS